MFLPVFHPLSTVSSQIVCRMTSEIFFRVVIKHLMKDESIITELTNSNVTQKKLDQLTNARLKAVESRRRTQQTKLEKRLHDVKMLLGDLNEEQIQRAMSVMVAAESARCQEIYTQHRADMQTEFKSLKRHIDAVRDEIRDSRKPTATLSSHRDRVVQTRNLQSRICLSCHQEHRCLAHWRMFPPYQRTDPLVTAIVHKDQPFPQCHRSNLEIETEKIYPA